MPEGRNSYIFLDSSNIGGRLSDHVSMGVRLKENTEKKGNAINRFFQLLYGSNTFVS